VIVFNLGETTSGTQITCFTGTKGSTNTDAETATCHSGWRVATGDDLNHPPPPLPNVYSLLQQEQLQYQKMLLLQQLQQR
jgi:hypothetical protein